MKKFKLLSIALALLMFSPATFAAASNSATSELSIEVPKFINITENADPVKESSATFNDSYTTITLSPQMNVAYTVITNHNGENVRLRATGLLSDSGTSQACLAGSVGNLKLIFTNNTHAPAEAAITDINKSTPAVASNPNAIAFSLTPVLTPDGTSGATSSTPTFDANNLTYKLKNGKYGLALSVGTSALTGTFSTHDEDGTYMATLILEQVVTP